MPSVSFRSITSTDYTGLWPTSSPLVPPQRSSSCASDFLQGRRLEILMVRRNDKVAFMAGSSLPGGRVDDGDQPPSITGLPRDVPDLSDTESTARLRA